MFRRMERDWGVNSASLQVAGESAVRPACFQPWEGVRLLGLFHSLLSTFSLHIHMWYLVTSRCRNKLKIATLE